MLAALDELNLSVPPRHGFWPTAVAAGIERVVVLFALVDVLCPGLGRYVSDALATEADLHEPRTLDAVSRYVMHERPLDATSPFVFLVGGRGTRRLEPLGYDAVVRLFARRLDKLGLRTPETTPHALRHTHVTAMWEGGMRLHDVHVLLFNIGQVPEPPFHGLKTAEPWRTELIPPETPPALAAPVSRWLSGQLQTSDRAESVRHSRDAFRYFLR